MSRNQKIRIAMVVCGVVVIVAVLAALSGIFNGTGYTFANAEKYTAGDAEIAEPVNNLEIDWVEGQVRIEYADQNTVTLRETAPRAIGEDQKLRWWLDGDTLRLHYAKSGWRQLFGIFNGNNSKTLTLTLPEGTAMERAVIHTVSADQVIPALKARTMELTATSGDMQVTAEAEDIRVNTVSGDQTLRLTGTAQRAELTAISGDVRAEIEASGETKISTTSGQVSLKAGKTDRTEISTVSGDVSVALPEEPGFTAEVSTVSGKLDSTMPLTKEGSTYISGDGSEAVEISTVSGDIRVEAQD